MREAREASKEDVEIGENPGQPTTPRKGGGPCANSSPDELLSIPSPKTPTPQTAGTSTAGKSKNKSLIAGKGLNVNFKPQIPVFVEKLRPKQTKQPSNWLQPALPVKSTSKQVKRPVSEV